MTDVSDDFDITDEDTGRVMKPQVQINVRLRPHQLREHLRRKRFNVRVWHRRSGKTWHACVDCLQGAVECVLPDARIAYIAPTRVQAKAIAWLYLQRFTEQVPGVKQNETELTIRMPGTGAEITLLGAEQYDSLRGRYLDGLVLDEAALVPRPAWSQVLLPALSDRLGWAVIMGTPMGRMNLLYDLWQLALHDDEWCASMLKITDTNVLLPAEVDRLRRSMRPEEFEQEFMCSFNAATLGAYLSKEVAKAEASKRVTDVRYDSALPVIASVDLGWSDAMTAGFWQQTGTEHRCIMARAWEQTSIPDMVNDWRQLPFKIAHAILPHDARVHELGSGLSRQEVFHQMGVETSIAPDVGLHEGIEQLRELMPHMWFDRTECQMLVEAMLTYRAEHQEVRGVMKKMPVHDWSSHWVDMARYYAIGRPVSINGWGASVGGWGDNSHLYRRLAQGMV